MQTDTIHLGGYPKQPSTSLFHSTSFLPCLSIIVVVEVEVADLIRCRQCIVCSTDECVSSPFSSFLASASQSIIKK
jgi:hypothetical protein